MSSLMLLLVWLIFFMVLIKLLPILGTISGKTVKLDRKSGSAGMPRPISYAVFCLKKKKNPTEMHPTTKAKGREDSEESTPPAGRCRPHCRDRPHTIQQIAERRGLRGFFF